MKIKDCLYYIKKDRWDEFLKNYSEFGFVNDKKTIYPQYIVRKEKDSNVIRIGISKPCVNVWDGEDKNGQREIWLKSGNFGYSAKSVVYGHIKDLIESGYVESEVDE